MIEALAARARAGLAAALGINRRVWRVGHISAPLEFVPHPYCSWQHRFDDPEHAYRTLYCAEDPVTCLREVLADLRPDAKARAEFEDFQLAQGVPADQIHHPAREVTVRWRTENVLAPAIVERAGPLANLEDRLLLERLADTHAHLLTAHGMAQLDLSQITSETRPVTQAISRDLFERGAAGVLFRSNLDAHRCIVLFESRARLRGAGRITRLTDDHPALLQVCSEYGLVLRAPARSPEHGAAWRP